MKKRYLVRCVGMWNSAMQRNAFYVPVFSALLGTKNNSASHNPERHAYECI